MPVLCLALPKPEHKALGEYLSGLEELTTVPLHSQLGTKRNSLKINYTDLHAIFHVLNHGSHTSAELIPKQGSKHRVHKIDIGLLCILTKLLCNLLDLVLLTQIYIDMLGNYIYIFGLGSLPDSPGKTRFMFIWIAFFQGNSSSQNIKDLYLRNDVASLSGESCLAHCFTW